MWKREEQDLARGLCSSTTGWDVLCVGSRVCTYECLCFHLPLRVTGWYGLVSAEIGDYDETLDREHLKANEYLPSQERALEKILEFHRKHT